MARRVILGETPYLKLLLYGQPGSTKTRTASTAALDERTAPSLMLEAAGNPESIRDYPEQPDIIRIEDLKDVNAPYDWIKKGQPENHPLLKEFPGLRPPYKSVIVDQLTDVQRLSFATVTGNKGLSPGTHPTRTTIQHFGQVLGQMINFANLYFSLDIHVIMTCLEKRSKNEATGSIHYSALLWGQSDVEVPGFALAVARLQHISRTGTKYQRASKKLDDEPVSAAFFTPDGSFDAKDQYGALPPWMPDPTITKMLDLIYGPD